MGKNGNFRYGRVVGMRRCISIDTYYNAKGYRPGVRSSHL
jgi:hypothetical protein